jgi:hypothetical protein
MSNNLPVRRGGLLPTRAERQLGKELERISARNAVVAFGDFAEIARIRDTTKAGMRAAFDICNEEALLSPGDPLAQVRVRIIADAGALCIADVVKDARMGL